MSNSLQLLSLPKVLQGDHKQLVVGNQHGRKVNTKTFYNYTDIIFVGLFDFGWLKTALIINRHRMWRRCTNLCCFVLKKDVVWIHNNKVE